MTILALLYAWLLIVIAPDTPIGRFLHRMLVATPARWLSQISRGHILLAILLFAGACVTLWLFEGGGLQLIGMAAPDIAIWIATFEVTTYLDVAAATLVAASTLRLSTLRGWLRTSLSATLRRSGRRTSRARRPARPKADNDDEAGARLLAA